MSVNYAALAASDGLGEAVRATVQTARSIGGTTITVDHTTHWPTGTFIATTGTLLSTGKLDPTTVQVFYGTASGTTITISSFAPGYSDLGNAQDDVVVLKPSTEWANGVATAAQAMSTFVTTNGDWRTIPTPDTITALGNRSYSLVFNNIDLTGILSPKMRLRTTRTVASPTQCTSLNGSTQYYAKSSPAGMTFTNFPVASAWVKLSSYAAGSIISRYNGTSGWDFSINANGQVVLTGFNAGSSNINSVTSNQSIPLNKWTHVAAELDMSTSTLDGTHSYVMINGVNVLAFKTTGGTNPTALIQAGNLEVGSRNGGTQPFPGKLAQVAVFSAAVTQSTILGYISQSLAGNEASLISAYSFNNSITDLNANANNLTANGSAVATNADSPFGGQADGSISSTKNYAITMTTTFSTNTTVIVQVPAGCTIATSGGLSALEYSTMSIPYGFPSNSYNWDLNFIDVSSTTSLATNTSFANLTTPAGVWSIIGRAGVSVAANGSNNGRVIIGLSTASNSITETFTLTGGSVNWTTGTTSNAFTTNLILPPIIKSFASATAVYLVCSAVLSASATINPASSGTDYGGVFITASNCYL